MQLSNDQIKEIAVMAQEDLADVDGLTQDQLKEAVIEYVSIFKLAEESEQLEEGVMEKIAVKASKLADKDITNLKLIINARKSQNLDSKSLQAKVAILEASRDRMIATAKQPSIGKVIIALIGYVNTLIKIAAAVLAIVFGITAVNYLAHGIDMGVVTAAAKAAKGQTVAKGFAAAAKAGAGAADVKGAAHIAGAASNPATAKLLFVLAAKAVAVAVIAIILVSALTKIALALYAGKLKHDAAKASAEKIAKSTGSKLQAKVKAVA